VEKARRDVGYFVDCSQERLLVCVGRFIKTADLSHELKRSSPYLFRRDWRIEVEKGFDIPAHSRLPQALSVFTQPVILNPVALLVMRPI
jgi:hypothetical protein